MEFNYIAVFCLYMTSLLVIRHASCIPGKFLLPDVGSLTALPPVSLSALPPVSLSALPPVSLFALPPVSLSALPPVSLSALPPVSDLGSTITTSILGSPEASPAPSSSSSSSSGSSPETSITAIISDITSNNNLIEVPKKVVDACKNTDHPKECSNSVTPLLEGNFEPVSILQGETKAFDRALEVAKEDIGGENGDDEQTISTCKQMYENAREEISKAMELASKNDKYGVNIYLSAALTFIDTCKDEIPKDMKDDSKMVQTNKLLEDLASNTLALGNFALGLDTQDN